MKKISAASRLSAPQAHCSRALIQAGLKREDVFVTNSVKHFRRQAFQADAAGQEAVAQDAHPAGARGLRGVTAQRTARGAAAGDDGARRHGLSGADAPDPRRYRGAHQHDAGTRWRAARCDLSPLGRPARADDQDAAGDLRGACQRAETRGTSGRRNTRRVSRHVATCGLPGCAAGKRAARVRKKCGEKKGAGLARLM
jgi:hypothetical protein